MIFSNYRKKSSKYCRPFSAAILYVIAVIFLLFAHPSSPCAQEVNSEAIYKRGLARFQQEKYVSARLDFTEIITHYPKSSRVTSSFVMLSKSFFELGDYRSAESTALSLKRSHPDSRYIEWTSYLIAACRLRLGNIEEAAVMLANLASYTSNGELKYRAIDALRREIKPVLDNDTLNEILRAHNISLAENVKPVAPPETKEPLAQEKPVKQWTSGSTLKIGLLLPQSGRNAMEGDELLRGVRAALSNYETVNGVPLELLIEDSESNPIQSILKVRKLIDDGVVAVIGPVYGDSTIPAALECSSAGIPFIAPTAPDVDLPLIGEYVFQINQTPVIQAEELADFVTTSLGFSNAAIIASDDWWGMAVASTFTEKFEANGGVILRTEQFDSQTGGYNIDELIMKIRASAPESGAEADSLVVFEYGNAFADTVIVFPDEKLIPQKMKPVKSIDCILVSALYDDAMKIVPVIRDYQIQTVLLGDTGWSDERAPIDLGNSGEGIYLISTMSKTLPETENTQFSDNYLKRKMELTGSTSRKGYDACALIIHCLLKGSTTPSALKRQMENVKDFSGLSGRYTIDPIRHINTAVDFVRIQNGEFVLLNRIGVLEDTPSSVEIQN